MVSRLFTRLIVLSVLVWLAVLPTVLNPAPANAQTPTPACDPAKPPCAFKPLPEPRRLKVNEAEVAKLDLKSVPLIPAAISNQVKLIFAEGAKKGNNARVFSKVGDCMTAAEEFMKPYTAATTPSSFDLDSYSALQNVIKVYANQPARVKDFKLDSFANPGMASAGGFTVASVGDPLWADAKICGANQSPLACEFALSKPSLALIMFGTNDVKYLTADDYSFQLRSLVVKSANAGVVPILSTFPEEPGFEQKSLLFNKIIVKVAQEYDMPLVNLWRALEPLPDKGIDKVQRPDRIPGTHLTRPEKNSPGNLTQADLQFGYNVRNLLTLQTLEVLLKAVKPDLLASTN